MKYTYHRIWAPVSLVIALSLAGAAQAQSLYKWKDSNGKTYYSDQKPEPRDRYRRYERRNGGSPADVLERSRRDSSSFGAYNWGDTSRRYAPMVTSPAELQPLR